jgi:hypothetical protein
LARPDFGERGGSLLEELTLTSAQEFLSAMDLRDGEGVWRFTGIRLSQDSRDEVRRIMGRFIQELRALGKAQEALPPTQAKWYGIIVAAEPLRQERISLLGPP